MDDRTKHLVRERDAPPSARASRRRARRWLGTLAGAATVAALLAWQVGAWYVERPLPTAPGADAAGPTCGGAVAPRYRGAVPLIRAQVRAMMAARRIPGMAVAVAVRGHLVYREGFGYADLERRVPACPGTRFRAASVSKLFTAEAMGRLYEAGRLDLDAPVQRYVPSFPATGGRITPALLASHRAGIRAYHDDREAVNTAYYPSVTASLTRFADDPLVAAPGTRFVYSNYGYVLLSAAIEGAAGEDFLPYLRDSVFRPLGMRSTVPDQRGVDVPARSATYDTETPFSPDGRLVRSPDNDFSVKWASGGFLSTVEDLVRFGSAHLPAGVAPGAPAVLRPETVRLLVRPRSGLPPLAGYGLGWMAASDLHLRRVHFHFGASSGGTAVLAVYPGSGVVVAVMANLGHAKLPFRPLVNLVAPFLPRVRPDETVLAAAALLGIGVALRRRLRRPVRWRGDDDAATRGLPSAPPRTSPSTHPRDLPEPPG
jgi:serine beta-lactamase-like protein LACTB, mitochondrial